MQSDPAGKAVRRKVAWRVLPLAFVLYIVANLDRANAGFAKLAMASDLGFSDQVFGLGFGIFFIGYLLLEIPGAILVERWSARGWFARILISWGLLSALTGFVKTPGQFYAARFFLGIAEAGFFPGIIVYFTHWFVGRDRARALSVLIMAVPLSLALGAPLSARLLSLNWRGMHGWQWMFFLEGAPALLIGVFTLFALTDRPRDAKWLKPEEKVWLQAQLDTEASAKTTAGNCSAMKVLMLPQVWILALGIFATNTGGYALVFWLPTALKGLSGASNNSVLGWSGLIHACGLLSVFVSGQSSDRTGERKWHCVAGQVFTAIFLAVSIIPGQPFWLVIVWLCCTGLAGYFWATPFWALPTVSLGASAAATAVGIISMAANLAGYFGNRCIGALKGNGYNDRVCLLFLAGCYLAGGIIISFLTVLPPPKKRKSPSPIFVVDPKSGGAKGIRTSEP